MKSKIHSGLKSIKLISMLALLCTICIACKKEKEEETILIDVTAQFDIEPSTKGVSPFEVNFKNTSFAANKFEWKYTTDGIDAYTFSNEKNPTYTFNNNGNGDKYYAITLCAIDSISGRKNFAHQNIHVLPANK